MKAKAAVAGLGCLIGLWAATTAAAERVTIDTFKGDKKGAVRAGLASVACAQWECVPPSRVTKKKKLNWPAIKNERLSGVLQGALLKKKGAKLSLTLLGPNKKVIWRRALRLVKNRLVAKELSAALEEATAAMQATERASPPVAISRPPPSSAERPPPPDDRPFFSDPDAGVATSTPNEPDAGTPPTRTMSSTEPDVGAPAAPQATEARVQPIIVAELGADVFFRYHAFAALETPNLFGYRGNGIVMPSLHAEVYPLAPFVRGLAAGIGVTGDVAFAVGLNSSLPDGTRFPTRVIRYGVGLKWAIRPIQGSGFNFGPEVQYRGWSFEVLPGANSTTIPELPPLSYQGLDLALALEIPLGSVATLSARGSYQPVFRATELISPAFFPQGSAQAFSAEASLGFYVGLGELLEVRLTGMFTQYNLHFDNVDPGATYRAAGATDRYLGARLGVRVRW